MATFTHMARAKTGEGGTNSDIAKSFDYHGYRISISRVGAAYTVAGGRVGRDVRRRFTWQSNHHFLQPPPPTGGRWAILHPRVHSTASAHDSSGPGIDFAIADLLAARRAQPCGKACQGLRQQASYRVTVKGSCSPAALASIFGAFLENRATRPFKPEFEPPHNFSSRPPSRGLRDGAIMGRRSDK